MTLLALIHQATTAEAPPQLLEKARSLIARLLLPKHITPRHAQHYIRKALRTGVWRTLPPQAKALLHLLRRWPKPIKSPTLTQILEEILLKIELATTRGQALLYGTLLTLRQTPPTPTHDLKAKTRQLLIKGLSYINNPPTLRILG